MEIKETQVPVPWGHVAVKIWGNEQSPPVLVIHGLLDNAGSMDRLIEQLPTTFCYYAIDLPGHGKSSHWPASATIHTVDNLLTYKAVVDHFGREQYIVLGHSWGGQCGLLFTLVYPEHVVKLIMLDCLFVYPITAGQFRPQLNEFHRQYFGMMEKFRTRTAPHYTREEALDRMMNQRRYGELSQAAAERILERNMIPTDDGKLRFSTDQRLKSFLSIFFDFRYIVDLLKRNPVTCPVLIILASESHLQAVYFKPVTKVFKKLPNFVIKEVEGTHDVHNNHPERVSGMIGEFMLKPEAKRRGRKSKL